MSGQFAENRVTCPASFVVEKRERGREGERGGEKGRKGEREGLTGKGMLIHVDTKNFRYILP